MTESLKYLALIVGIILIDQITKVLAAATNCDVGIIKWVLSLDYTQNTGAAFGIFSDTDGAIAAFIALTSVAVLILLWIFHDTKSRFLKLSISFLVAGALGNLIDRAAVHFVRDFINLEFFANFNIADMGVTAGVVMIAVYLLYIGDDAVFGKKSRKKKEAAKKKEEEREESGSLNEESATADDSKSDGEN